MIEMMHTNEQIHYAMQISLPAQVLQVINPAVTYRVGDIKVAGLAIAMQGFLHLLDKYGIEHENEECLRRIVRSKPSCLSRAKQFFLRPGAKKKMIERRDSSSVSSLGCICIPNEDVPAEFYDNLPEGEAIQISNLISTIIS